MAVYLDQREPIKSQIELLRFVLSIVMAHGNMISTKEASEAIEKAFKELEHYQKKEKELNDV